MRTATEATTSRSTSLGRTLLRILLGISLLLAGVSHLTTNREAFRAQVPEWLPLDIDFVVVASGVVEILLGLALIVLVRLRIQVGIVVALFLVAVFPGNISQYLTGTDSLGLDTDMARFGRLFMQPVLVLWALWSTGAWRDRREWRRVLR